MASLGDLNTVMELIGDESVKSGADSVAKSIDGVKSKVSKFNESVGKIQGRVNVFTGALAGFGLDTKTLATKLGVVGETANEGAKTALGQVTAEVSKFAAVIGGAKGGSALGGAIGSAIAPGIGTAIGAAIGTVIGGVAAAILGEAANKYVSRFGDKISDIFLGTGLTISEINERITKEQLDSLRSLRGKEITRADLNKYSAKIQEDLKNYFAKKDAEEARNKLLVPTELVKTRKEAEKLKLNLEGDAEKNAKTKNSILEMIAYPILPFLQAPKALVGFSNSTFGTNFSIPSLKGIEEKRVELITGLKNNLPNSKEFETEKMILEGLTYTPFVTDDKLKETKLEIALEVERALSAFAKPYEDNLRETVRLINNYYGR